MFDVRHVLLRKTEVEIYFPVLIYISEDRSKLIVRMDHGNVDDCLVVEAQDVIKRLAYCL